MAAHPQLTWEQTMEMVLYILSLGGRVETQSDFPSSGEYLAKTHIENENKGKYLLMASYTDNGHGKIKPITQHSQVFLRYNQINAEEFNEGSSDFEKRGGVVREIYNNDYIVFNNIDLTDIDFFRIKREYPEFTELLKKMSSEKTEKKSLLLLEGVVL